MTCGSHDHLAALLDLMDQDGWGDTAWAALADPDPATVWAAVTQWVLDYLPGNDGPSPTRRLALDDLGEYGGDPGRACRILGELGFTQVLERTPLWSHNDVEPVDFRSWVSLWTSQDGLFAELVDGRPGIREGIEKSAAGDLNKTTVSALKVYFTGHTLIPPSPREHGYEAIERDDTMPLAHLLFYKAIGCYIPIMGPNGLAKMVKVEPGMFAKVGYGWLSDIGLRVRIALLRATTTIITPWTVPVIHALGAESGWKHGAEAARQNTERLINLLPPSVRTRFGQLT